MKYKTDNENKSIKKKAINIPRLLLFLAVIFLLVSIYFGIREPMSLLLVLPSSLMAGAYSDRLPKGGASVCVMIICVASLLWVNSIAPIWGDRYDDNEKYEEIIATAKKEEREKDSKRILMISRAKTAVKNVLKDSSSAVFDSEVVSSKSGNEVVCGFVNSKNSFGAYSGNQRYISNGISAGTFLEEQVSDFDDVWLKFCG